MEERSDVKNKLEEGVRNEMMSNKQGAQNYRWVSTSLPPIYPPQGETRRCLLSTTFSIKCSWCCEWKAWRIPCMECWLAAKASLLFSVNLSTWWTWSFHAEGSLVNLMGVSLVSPWKVEGEYKETRLVRPRGAAGNPPDCLNLCRRIFCFSNPRTAFVVRLLPWQFLTPDEWFKKDHRNSIVSLLSTAIQSSPNLPDYVIQLSWHLSRFVSVSSFQAHQTLLSAWSWSRSCLQRAPELPHRFEKPIHEFVWSQSKVGVEHQGPQTGGGSFVQRSLLLVLS